MLKSSFSELRAYTRIFYILSLPILKMKIISCSVVHNIKGKHTNILALYKSLDKQTVAI